MSWIVRGIMCTLLLFAVWNILREAARTMQNDGLEHHFYDNEAIILLNFQELF